MSDIPIKKAELSPGQIADDLKVDLRKAEQEKKIKQPRPRRLFLSIFLILLIIFLGLGWFFSARQGTPFTDLIPPEAVVFSVIDQAMLYQQTSPFSQLLKENNFYGQAAIANFSQYLNRAGLDFQKDIQPLFEKKIGFVLMPSNYETTMPFAFILEKNASAGKISQILDSLQTNFKKDFNFSSRVYRQIEIMTLRPLLPAAVQFPKAYAYAQIEDYLIISNSQEVLEKIIKSIIDN